MKFTKYGHAAYLIEDAESKILIDPGSYSSGFEAVTGLTAILYTHVHPDHYDESKLAPLLVHNPDVTILAEVDTAAKLREAGHEVTEVAEGELYELGSFHVEVVGHDHAVIYSALPQAKNVGYFINGRVFYPGDALTVPTERVEILLLPVEAPWTKVAEVVDYMLQVQPKVALPSHELVSAVPQLQYGIIGGIASKHDIDFRPLKSGEAVEL